MLHFCPETLLFYKFYWTIFIYKCLLITDLPFDKSYMLVSLGACLWIVMQSFHWHIAQCFCLNVTIQKGMHKINDIIFLILPTKILASDWLKWGYHFPQSIVPNHVTGQSRDGWYFSVMWLLSLMDINIKLKYQPPRDLWHQCLKSTR